MEHYYKKSMAGEQLLWAVEADKANALFEDGAYSPLSTELTKELHHLMRNGTILPRRELEYNTFYKQLVVYTLVCQDRPGKVFRAARAAGDSRLVGLNSVGIGGHMEHRDAFMGYSVPGAISYAAKRELNEEFQFSFAPQPLFDTVGVVNTNKDGVSSVHLGIVVEARVATDWFKCNEPESFDVSECGFATWEELGTEIDQHETWSQIIIQWILR